jgi:hypothetical protein
MDEAQQTPNLFKFDENVLYTVRPPYLINRLEFRCTELETSFSYH